MITNEFIVLTLFAIALEMLIEFLRTKSTPLLLKPYLALIGESKYLLVFIMKPRFSRWAVNYQLLIKLFKWKTTFGRLVELEALERHLITSSGSHQLLSLSLQKYLSLDGSRPYVLIGEPGSGKTTALESIATQTAEGALNRQIVYWGIFLFTLLMSSDNFISLLLGLLIFGLIYSYMLPTITIIRFLKELIQKGLRLPAKSDIPLIPIFIDARSGYAGGNVKDWCQNIVKQFFGNKKLRFNQYDGIAWIIDGVNEISESLYPTFVEGWREILRDSPSLPIVFSSRLDQNPSHRLGLENILEVCALNDSAIKKLIEISYISRVNETTSQTSDDKRRTDFQELQKNGLLGEHGIGRNPYWLMMILRSDFYTPNKGKLFTKYIEELLTREIEKKPEERKRISIWKNIVPIEVAIYALSNLAYAMHEASVIGFSTEDEWKFARKIIRNCIEDMPYTVDDVLEEAQASSLLLIRYRDGIEFVHQLVQEFFTAIYINDAINNSNLDTPLLRISDVFGESLFHKEMKEIVAMLIGISDYQMEIVDWLANQIVERRHKNSIALLKQCIEIIYETTDKDVSRVVVDILLGCMHDPDIHIRWDTVVVLGEIKNPSSLEPLIIDLVETDTRARQDILKIIKNRDYPSTKKMISLLKSDNSSVRKNAIEILGKLNDDWVIEPIISALSDSDPNVRWQAVYTLGKIGDDRALSYLERIANADDAVAHSKIRIADTASEAIWNIRRRIISESNGA